MSIDRLSQHFNVAGTPFAIWAGGCEFWYEPMQSGRLHRWLVEAESIAYGERQRFSSVSMGAFHSAGLHALVIFEDSSA